MHSDLEVGLDSAKTMGRSLRRAIASITGCVKLCGCPDTPMRAAGFRRSTAARKSSVNSASWANAFLWCARSLRLFTTRPFESKNQQRFRASASSHPSCTSAETISSPMPIPASPAPRKRYGWSPNPFFVMRSAEKIPASATPAVPWMSSSKEQKPTLYFSSRRKALRVAKSSSWTTAFGKISATASKNSSTSSS